MRNAMRLLFAFTIVGSACGAEETAMMDPGVGALPQCNSAPSCATPSGNKQTICGQIYDFATGQPFQARGTDGGVCTTITATGPCSLTIEPYDAIAYASNPGATAALASGGAEVDECGRFRVTDIEIPSTPFVALILDDVAGGSAVPVAIAVSKVAGQQTKDVETWFVNEETTAAWEASGGPALVDGIYAPIYRAHVPGIGDPLEAVAGVTVTRFNTAMVDRDFYFHATEMDRLDIDADATTTGVNGTALLTGATITDVIAYSGIGGLGDETNCVWESHAGASLPGIVFAQIFRPRNKVGEICSR